jgi:AcrR family transcriptional regulator
MSSDLRSRKRLAMRQNISDVATRLFTEHGFDHVTVDDIAAAADVGRKTVFNYFPRKEDMFFDRDEEIRGVLQAVLDQRAPGTVRVDVYQQLAHQLVAAPSAYVTFSDFSRRFVETIASSATLQARARAIRAELADFLAAALAQSAGRPAQDPDAQLAANMLLTTWTVARMQAHHAFVRTGDAGQATAVFLDMIDKGAAGVRAALAETPYA